MTGRYKAYSEYKDSGVKWLGKIPEHWVVCALDKVIDPKRKITYGIVQPGKHDPDGRFMVRGQDYSFGWCDKGTIFRVSDSVERPYRRARLNVGDIVLTIVGAGVGNTEIVPPFLDGANITQTTARISPDHTKAVGGYIRYLFQSDLGRVNVERFAKGAAQPGLNLADVAKYSFAFPSRKEQKTIVNFLDHETAKIDTLITKQEKLIELLKEKRQAVISHAVTKGLNPDAPMKDSGVEWLGEVPEHWDVGRLKNVLKIRNGKDYKHVEVESGGYPVYGSGGVFKRSSEYLFDGESVLFGRKGTINKPLVVKGKFWTVDTMFYSELNKNTDADYVHSQSTLFPFDLLSTNTALPSMTQEDLLELGFVIPPIEEQQAISTEISEHNNKFGNLIDKATKQIKLMRERKTALISAAVTGKIDVRDWQL